MDHVPLELQMLKFPLINSYHIARRRGLHFLPVSFQIKSLNVHGESGGALISNMLYVTLSRVSNRTRVSALHAALHAVLDGVLDGVLAGLRNTVHGRQEAQYSPVTAGIDAVLAARHSPIFCLHFGLTLKSFRRKPS